MSRFAKPQLWYRDTFWKQLMLQRPSSVLDVGAGHGHLIARLMEEDIRAAGVDMDPNLVAAAIPHGLDIIEAPADQLPYGQGAFDWVVSEFSLHHFENPDPVLTGMLRVAQTGVLILDQWFDLDVGHQRVARDFNDWCKARDRAGGMVHQGNLQTADIHALMKRVAPDLYYTVQTMLMPVRADLEDMVADAAQYGLDPNSAAMQAFRGLFARAKKEGITHDGACLLTIHLE